MMSILDLNRYCQQEIMKYIIHNYKMSDTIRNKYISRKYADLINFALAHGNLEAILKEYDCYLYKNLEFVFVANRPKLEKEQKIYKNRKSILDLNEYCQRKIIKYIIADCNERYISRNIFISQDISQGCADLVNFALAHEHFEAIFKEYDNYLYKSLQFVFAANRTKLEIDFSELETTHTGKRGDAFWRLFANAISENNVVSEVMLKYDPVSFQPNFKDHFELIKRALEHKESLTDVTIKLQGYSLDDLNNFGHITNLDLDVRMNAEALVEVCKANPHLETLYFRSTEILGRLSDIAPHCPNLKYLEFAPKPDIDGVEYAPLAELPNLEEMTLYGASTNGSLLTRLFEAIKIWKRPGLQPLKIIFSEQLPIANL